jgi:hypothetical protein
MKMLLLAAAAASFLAAGCRTGDDIAAASPTTLDVDANGYRIERYSGRTVRVCGRLSQYEGRHAVEYVPRPGETFFHGPPVVLLAPCASGAPRLDRDGCLTGRIAAIDGSMTPPPQNVHDDSPVSRDWFLHVGCPRAADLRRGRPPVTFWRDSSA